MEINGGECCPVRGSESIDSIGDQFEECRPGRCVIVVFDGIHSYAHFALYRFSSIPYEKGFNFLYHLETVVGGSAVFEPFLKAFYKNFSHKTLTTEDMKQFLFDYMKENHPSAIDALNGVDWKTWLHSPGMPPVSMPFDQTLANECKDLAKK